MTHTPTAISYTMRRVVLVLLLVIGCTPASESSYRNGDIIFHESRSSQSVALRLAMNSRYTHMGVIYINDGKPFVYEAVGPVKVTPLQEWIDRGIDGHYVVKRLKDADRILTPEALTRLKEVGKRFSGRPYDLRFEWSDDRIYCSELVWKMYHSALGLEIGSRQTFADFDLSSPEVAAKIKERYPDGLSMNEPVISPASIFESPHLVLVETL